MGEVTTAPSERRGHRNNEPNLVVVEGEVLDPESREVVAPRAIPPTPLTFDGKQLNQASKELWVAFWTSATAQAVAEGGPDIERLTNWIQAVDQRRIHREVCATKPMVEGARGNLVRNPLFVVVRDLTGEIERAEEAFGMNPRARFRLGVEAKDAADAFKEIRDLVDQVASRSAGIPEEYDD